MGICVVTDGLEFVSNGGEWLSHSLSSSVVPASSACTDTQSHFLVFNSLDPGAGSEVVALASIVSCQTLACLPLRIGESFLLTKLWSYSF